MTMRTVGYPDLGPLCGYVPRVSVLVVAQAMAKPFTMAAGRRTLRRDQVPRPRTARPDLPRLQYANRVRDGHRPGPSDPWPVMSSWPAPRAWRYVVTGPEARMICWLAIGGLAWVHLPIEFLAPMASRRKTNLPCPLIPANFPVPPKIL